MGRLPASAQHPRVSFPTLAPSHVPPPPARPQVPPCLSSPRCPPTPSAPPCGLRPCSPTAPRDLPGRWLRLPSRRPWPPLPLSLSSPSSASVPHLARVLGGRVTVPSHSLLRAQTRLHAWPGPGGGIPEAPLAAPESLCFPPTLEPGPRKPAWGPRAGGRLSRAPGHLHGPLCESVSPQHGAGNVGFRRFRLCTPGAWHTRGPMCTGCGRERRHGVPGGQSGL